MNRAKAQVTAAMLFACLICAPSLAAAQPSELNSDNRAADDAKRLYAEGQEAFKRGDFADAERAYEASYALSQTYDTAANLGMAELKQSKWKEAAEHLDAALRSFPVSESKEARDKIEAMLVECKVKLLTLRITINVPGAKVTVNGKEVGVAPLQGDVYIEPGAASVTCSLPGYETETVTVQGTSRYVKDIRFDLKKKQPEERAIWPYLVFGGVAAAGAGLGIGLTVASLGDVSEAKDLACRNEKSCIAKGDQLYSDASTLQGVGALGFALAGAGLIGMVIYAAVSESTGSAGSAESAIAPWFGPGAGGLTWQRQF